jgi:hypothetical protein
MRRFFLLFPWIERMFRKEIRVEFILTVWLRRLLHPEWKTRISTFDAVSIKCMDGASEYKMVDALETAMEVSRAGCRVHAWGFHYCRDEEEARKEARAAADACERMGAVAYHWNAEKQWASSTRSEQSGMAFACAFKDVLPDVTLYANCFSSDATGKMISEFDRYEPMLYGTRRTTIARKFGDQLSRRDIPLEKRSAMIGTGRGDIRHDTRAWGYTDGPDGLVGLASKHGPMSLNYFRAGVINGEDMLMSGNSINPDLPEQIRRIRLATERRET